MLKQHNRCGSTSPCFLAACVCFLVVLSVLANTKWAAIDGRWLTSSSVMQNTQREGASAAESGVPTGDPKVEKEMDSDSNIESVFGMSPTTNSSPPYLNSAAARDGGESSSSEEARVMSSLTTYASWTSDGSHEAMPRSPVEFNEVRRWMSRSRDSRTDAFDRFFAPLRLTLLPTLRDCIDAKSARVWPSGQSWKLMVLELIPSGIARLPTMTHLAANANGEIAVTSSLALTLLRAEGATAVGDMYRPLKDRLVRGLAELRNASLNREDLDGRFLVLDSHAEYFYCVGDYTAPGDQMVLTLGCMGRYFARYPTRRARRRVPVLFPDPNGLSGLANTLAMLRDHIPETIFILLPRCISELSELQNSSNDAFIFSPSNVTIVFPSKIPTYSVAIRDFVDHVLVPRVLANRTLAATLPRHRRIAILSASGASSTGRSLTITSPWLYMLQTFDFVTLPSTLPMAERVWYLHHADMMISSRGSNDAVSHHLMSTTGNKTKTGSAPPGRGEMPRLVLSPSTYGGAIPGSRCKLHQLDCPDTAPIYYLFLGYYKDNLSLVLPEEIQEFVNVANRYMETHAKPYRSRLGWETYFP